MGKKKSCQEVIVPRPLDATETRLYGWVENAVLTQQSVVESDALPEFRRSYPLMDDPGAEGDYVLEAAGPSDRVSFQADEDGPHFLWVYQELFTRLGMRLPFSDFQRDVMTRCRVAVSQLHLNGGASFSPLRKCACTLAFAPPSDSSSLFMTSIPLRVVMGTSHSERVRAGGCLIPMKSRSRNSNGIILRCWLLPRSEPFGWITRTNLFLGSIGIPRFILDGSDAEVGKFLDDLLDVKMKRTRLDDLMAKMADPSRMGPRPVLPTSGPSATATAAAAATVAGTSTLAVAGSLCVESSSQAPHAPTASDAKKARKQPSKRERAKAFEKALGDDSTWEHEVDPLKVAFPANFDYRKALNAGLTFAPVREALTKMPPEQLLGESYHLHAKSLACLQVGVETALVAKVKAEKELSAALDQIEVLKGERDSALSIVPFKERATTLEGELSKKSLEHQSALDRIVQLEEDQKVLKAQLESSQLSLEMERKRAVAAEGRVVSLTDSLKTCEANLSNATESSEYWRSEWHTLGSEVTEMCQETLEVCLDQVAHLCPGVDFSAITLKSRWNPKGKRIVVPEGSDVGVEPSFAEKVVQEKGPPSTGDAAGEGGECPP
ncbi:hypothetical protein PIB30_016363 [Stylosanthes scabra]|uniref:Transposase (Putative), gypsy type n=1 Tax=Stylosanthes scabra TaxID=79078 RepID=A0ABU6T706_9FABA|nr:hypothetical protein [Stylosanthes scabra]